MSLKALVRKTLPRPLFRQGRKWWGRWRSRYIADPTANERALGNVPTDWRWRIDEAVCCPDNAVIPRVPDAGKLHDGFITMHNGIKVCGLGYYGAGNLNLLVENRGVHEPQEERAFAEVLRHIPDGGCMLELGAYWGFYSLWFAVTVPGARSYLIEPMPEHLRSSILNFEANGCRGDFEQAYIGGSDGVAPDGTPVVSVDAYLARRGIGHLSILHADIQGAEADMLRGAARIFAARDVDYVFISTHSNKLHEECVDLLREFGQVILASVNLDDTYSVDGLIVSRREELPGPDILEVSKKRSASLRERGGAPGHGGVGEDIARP